MSEGPVRLRRATADDAYALWLWANDAGTRASSHGRPPVSWASHVAWLDARLADPNALVLVALDADGCPVGSIRFDTTDGWGTARLSYVVAPEARGRGLARPLVVAGIAALERSLRTGVQAGEYPAATEVVAEVLPENEPSLRVFRALGWHEAPAWPADGGPARFTWRGTPRERRGGAE